ncbi:MAG: (d)CMP kinase [Geobacter sp.]|nr:(d)CMP kinase [Geobacter sp.]
MTRERGLVIAVDGPSGAGKSTISKALSQRLGYLEIDTGAMYRAMAWLARESGLDLENEKAVLDFCLQAEIELLLDNGRTRVLANDSDVTAVIRTPDISMLTSRISALKPVRDAMLLLQRKMGAKGGVVLDGRDIGTVVFPDAELKFFLSASAEERGRRRFLELQAKGVPATLEETVKDVMQRDKQDMEREIAPLRQADDAILIDSTGRTVEQVVATMEHFYTLKMQGAR